MDFIIPKNLSDQIFAQCRREAPKEACGMLGGRGNRVETVYEMTNADQSPISYSLLPLEQLKVMKALGAASQELVAVYHSHTATEAYPSPVDVSLAVYPEIFWVLVSLKDPAGPVLRAFHIAEGVITEDRVIMEG